MNNKQKQSLNKKIANWCGFFLSPSNHYAFEPNTNFSIDSFVPLPNFCDSMDALIKWACPKLDKLNCTIKADNESAIWSFGIAQGAEDYQYESNESPSMALSLAIEKIIEETHKCKNRE